MPVAVTPSPKAPVSTEAPVTVDPKQQANCKNGLYGYLSQKTVEAVGVARGIVPAPIMQTVDRTVENAYATTKTWRDDPAQIKTYVGQYVPAPIVERGEALVIGAFHAQQKAVQQMTATRDNITTSVTTSVNNAKTTITTTTSNLLESAIVYAEKSYPTVEKIYQERAAPVVAKAVEMTAPYTTPVYEKVKPYAEPAIEKALHFPLVEPVVVKVKEVVGRVTSASSVNGGNVCMNRASTTEFVDAPQSEDDK